MKGKLAVTAGLILTWKDESLMWNREKFGGMEMTYLPSRKIWKPLIYLTNTPGEVKPIGQNVEYFLQVMHNGIVSHIPGGVIEAACPADVSKFLMMFNTAYFRFRHGDQSHTCSNL